MKHLSLWELCERNPKRGFITGYSEGYIQEGSLCTYPAGEPGGVAGLLRTLRDSERGLCIWSVSLCGNS
jgi:hypothetical protein